MMDTKAVCNGESKNAPLTAQAFLILLLLSATGCVHLRMHNPPRPAEAVPASIASEFHAPRTEDFRFNDILLQARRHYSLRRVELGGTNDLSAPTIELDYYQSPRPHSPVIMLLPISGGGYEAESHFARYFAKHGYAVVLVRRREMSRETPTPSAINDWLKNTVADNKRALDWIERQPELDANRIGLFGISMGAIQGSLLTPLEPRIKAATLGLAGGDLPFILTYSTEKGIVRDRKKYLREHSISPVQFHDALARAVTWDPAQVAKYVEPGKVLLVLGLCDTVVPFRKGWELRREMGCPETLLLPTGHYTALLCIPYVQHECLKFFKKRLTGPPSSLRRG